MAAAKSVISTFSEDHTERLTGISKFQLRYWDRTGFYHPSYSEENRRFAYGKVYSFKDIVALRVLNVLRNQYSVPLQHLRSVSRKLSHLEGDRWTGVKLWVLNKRVIWQEPGSKKPQEIVSQQYVVPTLELGTVVADTKRDVSSLNIREKEIHGEIVQSRYISHNVPVIAGTRIHVEAIQRFYDAGYSIKQIMEEYPDLTKKDIQAALGYKKKSKAA